MDPVYNLEFCAPSTGLTKCDRRPRRIGKRDPSTGGKDESAMAVSGPAHKIYEDAASAIRHVGEVPQPRADVNVSALLAGGSLELGHQADGHPAAGFCLDALCPGPSRSGWCSGRYRGRGCYGLACGAASGPAGSINVPGQRIPQLPVVPGVQVDLVLGAVQPEADGTLGSAAVGVIDEQDLYLLSHRRPGFSHWLL